MKGLSKRLMLFMLLSGCGLLIACTSAIQSGDTTATSPPINTLKPDNKMLGWRIVCFHLAWQRQQEPDWSIGTQIAGAVIAEALKTLQTDIPLWRFHRRATDDAVGHTFSLMLYSAAPVAAKLYDAIQKSPVAQQLQKTGHILRIDFDPLDKNPKPNIQDTSDPAWPMPLQKTWPKFILGVSQMWLELIVELKMAQPDTSDQRQIYQTIHQQLTELWDQHGQHAWLHHLNALYGYAPTAIRF